MSRNLPKQGYTIEMWNDRKSEKHMLTGLSLGELHFYINDWLREPSWKHYQITCPKETK